jgi:hypothetical protein
MYIVKGAQLTVDQGVKFTTCCCSYTNPNYNVDAAKVQS